MPTRRGMISGAAGAIVGEVVVPGSAVRPIFGFSGVYLDAAFTHPFGNFAASAARDYVAARQNDPQAIGPRSNARRNAVAAFAALTKVSPETIAVVPSTMGAENLIVRALDLGPKAGVVTDALHYDASLVLYGELAKAGVPVTVVRPREGRIDLDDIDRAITVETRLVAVSLVSGSTGFVHDLAQLCALAHRKGALVYADIIQAAGAIPLDLTASGVDFAGCGMYKWLMGDFGCAFLYVRPDRLHRLRRVEVGWRQISSHQSHALVFEPDGPAIGTYQLGSGVAAIFEVSTPAWQSLAVAAASITWLMEAGVTQLAEHRTKLLGQLAEGLRGSEWVALTPHGSTGPIAAYALRDARKRVAKALRRENVGVSLYEHRMRISPSLYNTADDIARLLAVMRDV